MSLNMSSVHHLTGGWQHHGIRHHLLHDGVEKFFLQNEVREAQEQEIERALQSAPAIHLLGMPSVYPPTSSPATSLPALEPIARKTLCPQLTEDPPVSQWLPA